MDYAKLGLRVGLEIHQQVDTEKLFCDCPSELKEETSGSFMRRLRPTQSELGEVDRAAIEEARKKLKFIYQSLGSTCLVEADEEPPHRGNEDAIDVALEVALLLGAKPVDEIHFMRKIVIDGSNTSGFQRSALVAMNGQLVIDSKTIPVPMIGMEEDAARKIEARGDSIVYRLDRLGIPLVEMATGPVIESPDEAGEVALKLGSLLRATKKVKRGIGTIRNDLNISIAEGARIEVKGVQDLKMMSTYVENEVKRQLSLLEARAALKERGVEGIDSQPADLTSIFAGTECRVLREKLEADGIVLGIRLPGFSGLLKDRLGPELNGYALRAGVGGIFHSDELPAYGIDKEIPEIRESLKAMDDDAFLILADSKERATAAMSRVIERASKALEGVPEETRDPRPDGTTAYSRPLPGKARMYPETDVPPVAISEERLKRIEAGLPELPDDKIERLVREYDVHRQQIGIIVEEGYDDLFEELSKEFGEQRAAASMITNVFPELEREGHQVDKVSRQTLRDIFSALSEGRFSREALPDILRKISEGGSVEDSLRELGLKAVPKEAIESIIQGVIDEKMDFVRRRGRDAIGPLMGVVMERLRGRADGKLVSEVLEMMIKRALERTTE
ncbi:MAG: Glu-tRNA(Gln) amidotransferase subunit GatE [Thermoplasmata archaeon]